MRSKPKHIIMSSEKILLVDDHEIVRAGFRSLLGAGGDFTIIEAGSAEDGYAAFLRERPDVVIMDINMPGMGGIEAIRRILAQDANARIIVLSMYDDPSHIENTRRMGVLGYVTKRSAPEKDWKGKFTGKHRERWLCDGCYAAVTDAYKKFEAKKVLDGGCEE